ncbi:MAG: kelch repeat-containing protein [archaeon]|nr:kelch repeat-containing protein [archaeon]
MRSSGSHLSGNSSGAQVGSSSASSLPSSPLAPPGLYASSTKASTSSTKLPSPNASPPSSPQLSPRSASLEQSLEEFTTSSSSGFGGFVPPAEYFASLRARLNQVRQDQSFGTHGSLEALAALMMAEGLGVEVKERVVVKRRGRSALRQSNCFVGSEAVDWLMVEAGLTSRERATQVAEKMFDAQYFYSVQGHSKFMDSHNSLYVFTAQDSEPLLGSGETAKRKYEGLIQVFAMYPPIVQALSLCLDQSELAPFSKAIVAITRVTKTTESLVHHLLKSEFESVANEQNSCLRGNSLVTKIESLHSSNVGRRFLKELLSDIVLRVVNDKNLDLETNSAKVKTSEKRSFAGNVESLQILTKQFLDRITDMSFLHRIPAEIRAIAGFTSEYAEKHLPEQKYSLIGGFLLLRLVNPALIAPESHEMIPEGLTISPSARNNLVSISKLLQKLSNEKLFAPNEEMSVINEFLVERRKQLRAWLSAVSTDPERTPTGESWLRYRYQTPTFALRLYNLIDIKHLVFLHNALFRNAKKIAPSLINADYGEASSSYDEYERLDLEVYKVLAGLGPPTVLVSGGRLVRRSHKIENHADKPSFTKPFWLPFKAPSLEGTSLKPRTGSVHWLANGQVYVCGGASENGRIISTLGIQSFHLSDNTVCTLPAPASALPAGRVSAAATRAMGSVFIFGGLNERNTVLNELVEYDIAHNMFSSRSHSGAVPSPRYGHTLSYVEGALFSFGGFVSHSSRNSISNELWSYDITSSKWAVLASAPPAVTDHSVVVYNNSLWVFGGRSELNDPLNTLWEFNTVSHIWRLRDVNPAPPPRWSHSCIVDEDQQLMVVYGGTSPDGGELFQDLWIMQFQTMTWSRVIPDPHAFVRAPPPLSMHCAVFEHNRMTLLLGRHRDSSLNSSFYRLQLSEPKSSQQEGVCRDLASLVNNPTLADFVFKLGDRTIHAHRIILHARAPHLIDRLSRCTSDPTFISVFTPEAFLHILQYLYTGAMQIADIPPIVTVIKLSKLFDIPAIIQFCEQSLCDLMNNSNVFQIYGIAHDLALPYLLNQAQLMLHRRASLLIHSDEFRDLDPSSELFNLITQAVLNSQLSANNIPASENNS